jgi:Na+/H+ antiporter NhaC
MTAGCIVVGALFGDKFTISDTVNLSAGACEVNILNISRAWPLRTLPAYLSLCLRNHLGAEIPGRMIDDSQINGF